MNRIFSQDGPLTFILNTIADLVILNILTILFCIPVVTAGASLTAMYVILFLNVIPIMVLAGLTLPGYLTAYFFSGIFKRYEQTVGQNV